MIIYIHIYNVYIYIHPYTLDSPRKIPSAPWFRVRGLGFRVYLKPRKLYLPSCNSSRVVFATRIDSREYCSLLWV